MSLAEFRYRLSDLSSAALNRRFAKTFQLAAGLNCRERKIAASFRLKIVCLAQDLLCFVRALRGRIANGFWAGSLFGDFVFGAPFLGFGCGEGSRIE